MKVLRKGEIKIGAFNDPRRKKPLLGVMTGNRVVCYGNFQSEDAADAFMELLADFVGAEQEKEGGEQE